MSAKEMFEELGYILIIHKPYYMFYSKDFTVNDNIYTLNIEFNYQNKKILIGIDDEYESSYAITIKELKAINKQVEELGWR